MCQGYETRNDSTEYRPACDAIVLGSLIKGLSNAGLWPIPEAPVVTMSVTALGAKLMKLTCHLKPVKGGDSAHESCLFTTPFRKDLQRILAKMENGVSASDLEHMKAQAEKCGSKVIKS